MSDNRSFKKQRQNDSELSDRVLQINVDDIRPNRAQPRAYFDQNSIIRLADSIRRYGILQPLTVRVSDPEDSRSYELIAGERRLRAAKMLGYLTVPCIVKEPGEEVSAELAIVENLLREDLNMFEEAYGYRKLIENHHLTQDEVAKRMSISQSAVANKLRLLRLDYDEQKTILDNGLTERHARTLLRIDNKDMRKEILEYAIQNKLNVSATEELVEAYLNKKEESRSKGGENIRKNEPNCSEKLLGEIVRATQRYSKSWATQGKNADVNVSNTSQYTEINLKLYK